MSYSKKPSKRINNPFSKRVIKTKESKIVDNFKQKVIDQEKVLNEKPYTYSEYSKFGMVEVRDKHILTDMFTLDNKIIQFIKPTHLPKELADDNNVDSWFHITIDNVIYNDYELFRKGGLYTQPKSGKLLNLFTYNKYIHSKYEKYLYGGLYVSVFIELFEDIRFYDLGNSYSHNSYNYVIKSDILGWYNMKTKEKLSFLKEKGGYTDRKFLIKSNRTFVYIDDNEDLKFYDTVEGKHLDFETII